MLVVILVGLVDSSRSATMNNAYREGAPETRLQESRIPGRFYIDGRKQTQYRSISRQSKY